MTFTPGVATDAIDGYVFALVGQGLCVTRDDGVPRAAAEPADVFLGDLDGTPCFARVVAEAVPDTAIVPLRQLFGVLSDDAFAVAGRALGFTAWDRDHRFCGRCGAPTERSPAERVRTCSACGMAHYPRLSPAVIMLVERDGRALLARNARTRMPFFSTLAGFVEIGETLEETVAREVREEAGIEIADIRYFGSQPWPFSGSLMIGFTARHVSGEIHAEPTEIADAQWFSPDELPVVPPPLSIARALIDAWVARTARPREVVGP